jgi:hypothetical protein
VKWYAFTVCKVISTKGDEFSIRSNYVYAAVAQTFQFQVPDILESHSGNAEGVIFNPFQKEIQAALLSLLAAATTLLGLSGRLGSRPAGRYKTSHLFRFTPATSSTRTVATVFQVAFLIMSCGGNQLPVRHLNIIGVKCTKAVPDTGGPEIHELYFFGCPFDFRRSGLSL